MQGIIEVTNTNSGDDSQGEAFGLSGNHYLWILLAFVVSLLGFVFLSVAMEKSLLFSLIFPSPPFVLTTAYILFLKHKKPDGYDRDFLENAIFGSNWTMITVKSHPNPTSNDIFSEE